MGLLPQLIMDDILHHGVGNRKTHHYHMGELIAYWQLELVKSLPLKNFNGHLNNGYEDDLHYAKTQASDPVYVVWSHKSLLKEGSNMNIHTLDPITLNDVTDLENAPFVIEGKGEGAIKIYFESEENKNEYLDIPMHGSDGSCGSSMKKIFDEMADNPDTGSIN